MKIKYLLFVLPILCNAQEIIDEAIDFQVDSSSLSIEAQADIENLDDVSKKLYFDYKDTLNEYKSLKNYDDQLSKIINSQIEEISSIEGQLDSLDDINIDILPLLKRMIDSLRKFIEIDIPFLLNERVDRVNGLDDLILRSDVTTAEKYRNVFEAYQIEADFGKTIESYQGYISLNNQELAVDYFRLGRLGLFYRTPDGDETGYWNVSQDSWIHMGNDLNKEIKNALDISNRQSPPNFIKLPLKPIDEDK